MRHKPNRNRAGSTAETPLIMLILFALFAFPLIDMIALALAYSTVWFVAFQTAMTASTQTDFNSSLSSLVKKTDEFNGKGFTKMLKMTPIAGYKASGTDLYVDAVDFMDAGKSQTFGPNKAVPPPVDLTNRFYEISAESTYEVKPFIDLQAVPLLNYIQGLGAPITFTAKVKRCAEFPQGLVRGPTDPSTAPASAAQPAPTTSFASPISVASQATEPWNRPQLYDEIKAAGQQIVDHTVVQVKADNPNWTDTGITVGPGQLVWLDFRADGKWGESNLITTADGISDYPSPQGPIGDQKMAPAYALLGTISPTDNWIQNSKFDFLVGSALYKYAPQKIGPLRLGCNCPIISEVNDISNPRQTQEGMQSYLLSQSVSGVMTVRIIVTQSYI
ncbi:MAG: hypothetical protein IPK73_20940 [Candidatus Obscuribacter sp.]|nr:hypothetical protein [Candidatus Obscuribacter sp.]MBK9276584.1 hypothetical protein [Candidatus Obscuribacter sp.]